MNCRGKSFLVIPSEDCLIVLGEAIEIVTCYIGWIQKYEIARNRLLQYHFEVCNEYLCVRQNLRRSMEIIGIKKDGIFCSNRNIELTSEIYSVESIPTGAIKIKKPSSTLISRTIHAISFSVKVLF